MVSISVFPQLFQRSMPSQKALALGCPSPLFFPASAFSSRDFLYSQ
jgi:hypothetical protein